MESFEEGRDSECWREWKVEWEIRHEAQEGIGGGRRGGREDRRVEGMRLRKVGVEGR